MTELAHELPVVSIIIPVLHLKRPLNKSRFFMPRYTISDVLKDISKNVKMPHEVIVICNGNSPELTSFIRESSLINKYAINSINVGVARSWNMGAQMAEGGLLCYLNDDVEIGPGSIERLCAHFDDSSVGEVGPEGSYWSDLKHHSFVESNAPTIGDAISGFCFIVRRDTFIKLGGIDIEFTPAGYEEIDFSFRVRELGLTCLIDGTVNVKHHHYHGVSSYNAGIEYLNKIIDAKTLHERNTIYFKEKWSHGFPSTNLNLQKF